MTLNLTNKVAIITGAGSGIGEACAILFAELGAEVVLMGRNVDNLNKVKQECDKSSKKHLVLPIDITQETACTTAVAKVAETYGKIDILVNNAGIMELGTIETTSLDQYDKVMNINVRAAYHMTMLCVPHLIKSKGNIVNMSSVCGTRAFSGVLAYCVSKSALDQLTQCSAVELGLKGVRVNAVNPGVIVTDIQKKGGLNEEAYKEFLEKSKLTHPLGRPGEVREVAQTVAFLASDWASDTTAQLLHVDGGRHAAGLR